jgi:putative peptidoglycan binding protein
MLVLPTFRTMFRTTLPPLVIASALLLCASPLAAALRSSRTSSPSLKAHSPAHLRLGSSARVSTHGSLSHHASRPARDNRPHFHGQQAIDQARTLEIQRALIREHYLAGEATGEWDEATRDALIRLQADNHWQTKVLPDARALIRLGLGPSQQNLLNPETAAIATPYSSALESSLHGGAN